MINFKKSIDADVISLAEIGWTESRDDDQIKKYVKSFVHNNYGKKIDDDLSLIIFLIIDDLLSDIDMQRKEKHNSLTINKKGENLYPTLKAVDICT